MCVNDLVCQGAEPLFFLDYFATGRLDVDQAARVVEGIAAGCRAAGLRPGRGRDGRDAGDVSGRRFRPRRICRGRDGAGRRAAARASPRATSCWASRSDGVHSNGYSLVRRIAEQARSRLGRPAAPFAGRRARRGAAGADPALRPAGAGGDPRRRGARPRPHHRRRADREPAACAAPGARGRGSTSAPGRCRRSFGWLQSEGGIADAEMLKTFNAGIGLVVVVAADRAEAVWPHVLAAAGERRRAASAGRSAGRA